MEQMKSDLKYVDGLESGGEVGNSSRTYWKSSAATKTSW